MRKIYKRHNFAFSPELDELIRRLASETDWRLVQIVEKSIKMYAEFHDKEKNEK